MEKTQTVRILLIEDEPGDAYLIKELLDERKGSMFEIIHVEKLVEVNESIRKDRIDVILLDLGLPDSQGLETLEKVIERSGDLPIIVLTGLDDDEIGQSSLGMGAQDYLVKGKFDGEVLGRVVWYAIRRKKTEVERRSEAKRAQGYLDIAGVIILALDNEGIVTLINQKGSRILGYPVNEIIGKNWVDNFIPDRLSEEIRSYFNGYIDGTGQNVGDFENSVVTIQGNERKILWHNTCLQDINGRIIGTLSSGEDITERKVAEERLYESEERYQSLFNSSMEAVYLNDFEGNFIDANDTALKLTGYSRDEIRSVNYTDLLDLEDLERAFKIIQEMVAHGNQGEPFDFELIRKNGDRIWVESNSSLIMKNGEPVAIQGIARDITERKQLEKFNILSSKVLEILNIGSDKRKMIGEVIDLVKGSTGIEAVGIRLNEEEDYTYIDQRGFPDHFIKSENYLCARDENGNLILEDNGLPILECMCGNIIRNKTDPKQSFFTEAGSFWTNSTTELLDSTTEEDRQSRTRNHCHEEGYESVALIPLKIRDDTVGLLQLNDRRKNVFNISMIKFFEGLCESVGIAIARLEAEGSLKESEERSSFAIKAANAGTWTWDPKTNKVEWDNKLQKMFGLKPGSFKGTYEAWTELVHPEDIKDAEIALNNATKGGDPYDVTYRVKGPKHKEWHTLRAASILAADERNKISKMVGICFDITDHKQAEEALLQSEEKFRKLFNNSQNGICVTDPITMKMMFFNNAFKKLTGYSEDELLEMTILDLHPDAPGNEEEKDDAEKQRVKFINSKCYPILNKDGRLILTDAQSTMIKYGEELLMMGAYRDITAERNAEHQKEMRRKETEFFIDLFEHDIGNIHQAALMSLQMAKMKKPEEKDQFIDRSMRSMNRAMLLVKNIKEMKKVKGEKIEFEEMNLVSIIDQAVEDVFHLHPQKNADIAFCPKESEIVISSNPLLVDVFINILDNAIKFDITQTPHIDIKIKEGLPDKLTVEIWDRGMGISEEQRKFIFDRYSERIVKDIRGTGLGLSICREIVNSLNGRIWVDPRPDGENGSIFKVELNRKTQ